MKAVEILHKLQAWQGSWKEAVPITRINLYRAKRQISRYQSPPSGFCQLCKVMDKKKTSTFHKMARCRREKPTCVRSGCNEAHTNPWCDRWNKKPLALICTWEIKTQWCLFAGRETVSPSERNPVNFLLLFGLDGKVWMKAWRNQRSLFPSKMLVPSKWLFPMEKAVAEFALASPATYQFQVQRLSSRNNKNFNADKGSSCKHMAIYW